MMDLFPFPSVKGKTPEEQIAELLNYLIQFKETLEFALTNISTENLSSELINALRQLGADIEQSNDDRADEVQQITSNALSVSDVCSSETFKEAVDDEIANITFSINYDTGNLEYEI